MSKETAAKVEKLINSHTVFVASKTYCPYCRATKEFFSTVYPDAYVIELNEESDGDEIQDYLYQKTGQRTVPNIFIGGKHIGGNDDIQSIGKKKAGELIAQAKL
ncbi:DEKNAAC102702 [Brettanomyces naardenensis]|uniref:DEKNAAC102702 n=1 Tax=Brettanomyces naardenensis TaxID=13370 RepID=A0A448YLJ1_BRENA|nr:DEKNAAC102702 [Brettanomyces naardenensis]